jgi:hypothetical protein
MDCERVREEFVERLTGSLGVERSRLVDEHLGGCAACRAEADRMRELWAELGTLTVAPASGSASRVERLVDARSRQVASGAPNAPRWFTLPRTATAAASLAAMLVVGMLIGRLVWSGRQDTTTPGPVAGATAPKEKYILLLHGPARARPTTAAEAAADSASERALVAEYAAWAGQLAARGSLVAGEKLADEPLTMLASKGVVDVPRFTADELGGFFIIQADSAEAYRIARDCPHLKHGGTVQLRRIDPT